MIVLVEPVCGSWVHEEVNAGFLQMIVNNSADDILYVGEKEHVRCVRKLSGSPRVCYAVIKKTVSMDNADLYENTAYYVRLLNCIITRYRPERLFILCGYRPCLLATISAALIYRNMDIYFVLHGMIEEKKGRKDSYKKLLKFSMLCRRLHLISYSPYCTGKYWNVRDDKFIFLHHPYIYRKMKLAKEKGRNTSAKMVIGIIGACANDKALKLVTEVTRQLSSDYEYEFWVISRFGKKFRNLKNVRILDLEFERTQMERIMTEIDFLLMPYGRDEYTVSASGVLWDAIANGIPCFMLDSSYFKYYMKFNIGYLAGSMDGLCRIICGKIKAGSKEQEMFFTDLDKIEAENNRKIKDLLK